MHRFSIECVKKSKKDTIYFPTFVKQQFPQIRTLYFTLNRFDEKKLLGSEFIVLSHFAAQNVEQFRQINTLTLLSRNICQKCVRLNRSSKFPQILRWKLSMESYSAQRVLTRILQLDFTKYEFNFYLRVKLSLTNSMKQFRNIN